MATPQAAETGRPPRGGAPATSPPGLPAGSALLTRRRVELRTAPCRAVPREDGVGGRRHGRWAAFRLRFRHDGRTQRQAAASASECKGMMGGPGWARQARAPGSARAAVRVRVSGGSEEPGLPGYWQ
ncbi:hypothetical protein P7K49_005170 [Saguinus oedipus]|uniref:Uncharacterized protein n=1 Tax=Saguinus oedipus TaxID=9490 RepID=A0ABQ9WBY1_SAGOE|nr:hypothetical protein P7K49_005170 [Saguinus oedipus]